MVTFIRELHVYIQEEEHRRLVEEREAEVLRLAEEKALAEAELKKVASEQRIQEQTQDAIAVISDLDNALKAFQGALGLSDVSTVSHVCNYFSRLKAIQGSRRTIPCVHVCCSYWTSITKKSFSF